MPVLPCLGGDDGVGHRFALQKQIVPCDVQRRYDFRFFGIEICWQRQSTRELGRSARYYFRYSVCLCG